MPTYEYECLAEGHRFEEFQNITAPPLTSCPECGSEVRRLISGGAGFLFKGSGFYETDYRSESYKRAEKAERSAATESASSSSKSKSGTSGEKSGTSGEKSGTPGEKSGASGEKSGTPGEKSGTSSKKDAQGENRSRTKGSGS